MGQGDYLAAISGLPDLSGHPWRYAGMPPSQWMWFQSQVFFSRPPFVFLVFLFRDNFLLRHGKTLCFPFILASTRMDSNDSRHKLNSIWWSWEQQNEFCSLCNKEVDIFSLPVICRFPLFKTTNNQSNLKKAVYVFNPYGIANNRLHRGNTFVGTSFIYKDILTINPRLFYNFFIEILKSSYGTKFRYFIFTKKDISPPNLPLKSTIIDRP